MAMKRGHHEGSIYRKRDKWMAAVSYTDEAGNDKRIAKTCATKREAQAMVISLSAQRQQGADLTPRKQTVAEFLDDVLTKHFNRDESTREGYQRMMVLHVYPYPIGRLELAKLSPKLLADHYHRLQTVARIPKPGEKTTRPLSKRSVQLVHAILHKQFEQAVRWGLIPQNPAAAVDAPRPDKTEVAPLNAKQRGALLLAAQGDPWEALYTVALGTGMRVSELLGLRWVDVDFAASTVTVQGQAKRTKAGGLARDDTKTDRPRSIPVVPAVMAALRAHRDRQTFTRQQSANLWSDEGLVFPNERGKLFERQNLHRRSWKPLLERAGLPADTEFHTLRHTFATTCLQRGIDVTTVQHWLGHSTPKMLLEVYSHYIPAHGAAQLDKLAGYFAESAAI